jgi:glycosyltransferase involved in cell wall biosynthesis
MTKFKDGISIILPAYNEEANLRAALNDALSYLKTLKDPWEIIVVDDGSSDDTGKIAADFAKHHRRIKIISHQRNMGYGRSLSDGFLASNYNFVFFTDSDRQFDLKALDIMWPVAKTGVIDLVIGYRLNRKDPWIRRFLSRCYNILADILFDLDVKDIDCAFKIFKKEIFEKIKIESDNFFVNTEILAKARYFRYKILEVGVTHFPRKAGKSTVSFKYVPLTIRELIRIKKNLRNLKK